MIFPKDTQSPADTNNGSGKYYPVRDGISAR